MCIRDRAHIINFRQNVAIGANNLLMLALSNFRHKLFDLQTFQNQAHIISVTGIIIYFLGTYYLYASLFGGNYHFLEGLCMYIFCEFDTAYMYAMSNPQ